LKLQRNPKKKTKKSLGSDKNLVWNNYIFDRKYHFSIWIPNLTWKLRESIVFAIDTIDFHWFIRPSHLVLQQLMIYPKVGHCANFVPHLWSSLGSPGVVIMTAQTKPHWETSIYILFDMYNIFFIKILKYYSKTKANWDGNTAVALLVVSLLSEILKRRIGFQSSTA